MTDDQALGRRIAQARRVRRVTQAELAASVGWSYSHVAKVESGHRDVSPAFLIAAARALGVSRAELQGQPVHDRVADVLTPLRRELAAYAVPPEEPNDADLDHAVRRVAEVSQFRHSVKVARLGAILPGVLTDLRGLVHSTDGPTQERAFGLLAETYAAASQLAYKIGFHDLSSIAVDRYEWAAARSADPYAVAVGDYHRAGELLNVGEYAAAERVLTDARGSIDVRDGPAAISMLGNLHLKSALVTARSPQGNATNVWEHHAAATEAAERLGEDRDDYRLQFGPSNVHVWRTSLAVELRDADTAIRHSRLRLPPSLVAERRSHHAIDLARAKLWVDDRTGAFHSLNAARTIAPDHTRWHPQARETMRMLDQMEARRQRLSELKHWFKMT